MGSEMCIRDSVVHALRAGRLLPAIVFSFARKQCESLAAQAIGGGALGAALGVDDGESADAEAARVAAVRAVFGAAVAQLSHEDQALPAVRRLLPLLVRGVGLHHSGLLPILKEVVELLFQEGHIRLLFATETFAMGVNMPARTVVFSTLRKWDGESHRLASAGEYTQMAGRAGRRGLDAEGHVVLMLDDEGGGGGSGSGSDGAADDAVEAAELERLVRGAAEPLASSFKLRYNSVLKLHAMESADPYRMVASSFFAFQREAELRAARGGGGGLDGGDGARAAARLPPPPTPLHLSLIHI